MIVHQVRRKNGKTNKNVGEQEQEEEDVDKDKEAVLSLWQIERARERWNEIGAALVSPFFPIPYNVYVYT